MLNLSFKSQTAQHVAELDSGRASLWASFHFCNEQTSSHLVSSFRTAGLHQPILSPHPSEGTTLTVGFLGAFPPHLHLVLICISPPSLFDRWPPESLCLFGLQLLFLHVHVLNKGGDSRQGPKRALPGMAIPSSCWRRVNRCIGS